MYPVLFKKKKKIECLQASDFKFYDAYVKVKDYSMNESEKHGIVIQSEQPILNIFNSFTSGW